MSRKSKIFLHLQNIIGRISIFVIAPIYFFAAKVFFYRVRDLKEIRRRCDDEFARHKGPWIICANHLTMIDSFIFKLCSFSLSRHIINYKKLPWNLPERNNYKDNIILTILCYLSKCIPIKPRRVPRKNKRISGQMYLPDTQWRDHHDFSWGKRSRTGRVDREGFSYGVGRFIKNLENCKVMCMYLRGDKQNIYSVIPAGARNFRCK